MHLVIIIVEVMDIFLCPIEQDLPCGSNCSKCNRVRSLQTGEMGCGGGLQLRQPHTPMTRFALYKYLPSIEREDRVARPTNYLQALVVLLIVNIWVRDKYAQGPPIDDNRAVALWAHLPEPGYVRIHRKLRGTKAVMYALDDYSGSVALQQRTAWKSSIGTSYGLQGDIHCLWVLAVRDQPAEHAAGQIVHRSFHSGVLG